MPFLIFAHPPCLQSHVCCCSFSSAVSAVRRVVRMQGWEYVSEQALAQEYVMSAADSFSIL